MVEKDDGPWQGNNVKTKFARSFFGEENMKTREWSNLNFFSKLPFLVIYWKSTHSPFGAWSIFWCPSVETVKEHVSCDVTKTKLKLDMLSLFPIHFLSVHHNGVQMTSQKSTSMLKWTPRTVISVTQKSSFSYSGPHLVYTQWGAQRLCILLL